MNIRRLLSTIAWAALLAAGLAACGATPAAPGSPAAPSPTAAPAAPAPTTTPLPAPVATSVPLPAPTLPVDASTIIPAVPTVLGGAGLNLPQEALGTAVADLAGRLGVAAADISIVSAEAVEWSDGSLGCPQPGMMYPQVITPGVRVVLGAGGNEYAYHGDTQGVLFYCENPTR